MLDRLIRASIQHRLLVLVLALALLVLGGWELFRRPVDIFPDLNQPTVTVLAEAPGLAPEEVETLVTLPLESALGGAPGVTRMRSTSGDGLMLIRVEFGWDSDLYVDRQTVQERLQLASADLPPGVVPEMAPISSITGEVVNLGLTSPDGSVSLLDLHTIADWDVRRRLLSVPGVAQVVVIGGERKQFQVLADSDLLFQHDVELSEVADALAEASQNTGGGYLVQGHEELFVRNLGRVDTVEALARVVVAGDRSRPVLAGDVATVKEGPEYPRGAASVGGVPAVLLMIFKQPGVNTLALTEAVDQEVTRIRASLPTGVKLHDDLYRQGTFLQAGVDNVVDALRDGSILVVLVLLVFLANLRASLVTLVALPLSFATAGLVFSAMGLTLNTMTLGGLAIAVGELVDDAIVGVENVVRRLRTRWESALPVEELVAEASSEVRGPIFSGTLIVVLVFLPLFALSGIEGRLFAPLAIAYVVSLLASMVVSLTVTPVLSLLLFGRQARAPGFMARRSPPVLAGLQRGAEALVRWSVARWKAVIAGFTAIALAALAGATTFGSEFLPPFDEGTVLVMTFLPPGTSLAESDRVATEVERRVQDLEGVQSVARYTGRGQHDEHAPPVTISHVLLTVDPEAGVPRDEMLARVRERLADLPGVSLNVGQPLAHRIDHILSGVQAQVAMKILGHDLPALRETAEQVAAVARGVPGVTDLYVEPQVRLPQVHVVPRMDRLADVGLSPGHLARDLETAVGGRVVGQILEGERSFDLFVRLGEAPRASPADLRRLPVTLPGGGWARLGDLADVQLSSGPNTISRDDMQRRVAVTCNVSGRSLGEVVADLREALGPLEAALPAGTFLRFEGQFESQLRATRLILLLSLASLGATILVLFGQLRSLNLAFQVLACVPAAFVGGAALLLATGQPLSVSALVGFVSLGGIATRNGILLVSHALHLHRVEGVPLGVDLLARAGRERAAPVVMTALTTGVGLLPLLLSGGVAGREILHPVATVVVGGLLTSTFFEFVLRPALLWAIGQQALAGPGARGGRAPLSTVG